MGGDPSFLGKLYPNSSQEVKNVSPTPTAAQQQDTTVHIPTDDPTNSPCVSYKRWLLLRYISIFVTGYFIGFAGKYVPNYKNLCLVPYTMAIPFFAQAMVMPCNGVFRNLLMLFIPICTTCAVLLVGAILSPFAVLFLPWLLLSFLVARLLQFIRHGEAYDNLVLLKFYIRTWIYYLYLYSIASALAIFLAITRYVPSLQSVFYHEELLLGYMPPSLIKILADWQKICSVISFMLIFSTIFLILAFKFIPRVQLDLSESGINVPEAVLEIADCMNAFFWLKYLLRKTAAPAIKDHKILGLETWKWVLALIIMVIIHNVITILTRMFVWSLQKLICHQGPVSQTDIYTRRSSILQKIVRKRYLVYWVNGIRHSIVLILSTLLFLLAWLLYFKLHLTEARAKTFWYFGLETCLSFLTCASLWLIKTCVILSWEAGSIYLRLESKILQGAKQLYFLGILGRHNYDIFSLLYHDEKRLKRHENGGPIRFMIRLQHMFTFSLVINLDTHNRRKTDSVDEWDNEKKMSQRKMNRAKDYLLMQGDRTPSIDGIQQAALYFLMAKSKLLEENYTSKILEKLDFYDQEDENGSAETNVKRLILEENWDDFQQELDAYVGLSESVSFQARLKAWMEMAHKNCLFLANTLSSAKEVVDCLNKIISLLLIFATFIMWLLLTGLATTKVLVLIATPMLAVTFIFQSTCKILFEGIMFAYVVQPFNVGDLCIIDEDMMEVRTVGVWKTTFSKVGTQEDVIYSNSELSSKSIINHKTDYDWNDSVELNIGSLGKEKIKNLKQEIERYLDGEEGKFTPGYNSVEVSTTVDDTKLIVYFRHQVNLKHSTFFECLKEKRKLRSEFVLEAENLVNRYKEWRD